MKKMLFSVFALMLLFGSHDSFGMDPKMAKRKLRALQRAYRENKFSPDDARKARALEQEATTAGLPGIADDARSVRKRSGN